MLGVLGMPTFNTAMNTEIATRGLNNRYNRTSRTLYAQWSPTIVPQTAVLH